MCFSKPRLLLWYLQQGRLTTRHPENQRGLCWAAPPSALGSISTGTADDAKAMKPAHTWRPSYFRNPKHTHKNTQILKKTCFSCHQSRLQRFISNLIERLFFCSLFALCARSSWMEAVDPLAERCSVTENTRLLCTRRPQQANRS